MKTVRSLVFASLCCLFASAQQFVGTTPAGAAVRDFLGIPRKEPCDKITWQLTLSQTNTFRLTATYGLQEQSAPGFVASGTSITLEGKLQKVSAKVSQLTLTPSGRTLSLSHINENLIHPLDTDKKLMIGNEFWNYTLSRENAGRDK